MSIQQPTTDSKTSISSAMTTRQERGIYLTRRGVIWGVGGTQIHMYITTTCANAGMFFTMLYTPVCKNTLYGKLVIYVNRTE